MRFGLQKLTLLDYPEHVACTVFTAKCNLRCPFCHNSLRVTRMNDTEIYTEDDILMTKDHIKPKIAGGKDIVDNLQPMCSICNSEKSGEYPGVVKLTHIKSGKVRYFKNLEEATQQLIIDQFGQKCKKKSFKDTTKLIINTVYKIQEAYTTGSHYMNYKWEICE